MSTYLDEDAVAIRSALEPDVNPPPESDHLFVLYAVLMRAKGQYVTASDVHDAWAAWMQLKSPEHEALKPFEELESGVQQEDDAYVEAIRTTARVRAAAKGGRREQ